MIISRRKYYRDMRDSVEEGRLMERQNLNRPTRVYGCPDLEEYFRLLEVAANSLHDAGHVSLAKYIHQEYYKLRQKYESNS